MSFIVGVLLPKQVGLAVDRVCLMPGGKIEYPKKILEINPWTFLSIAGTTDTGNEIFSLISEAFGQRPVHLPSLELLRGTFQSRIRRILESPGEFDSSVPLSAVNCNCALAGVDSDGRPYLSNLNMLRFADGRLDRFRFRIFQNPGESFIIDPWLKKETKDGILSEIHSFLDSHINSPVPMQREALSETFKGIIRRVSSETCFVSPLFDMVFVDGGGAEERMVKAGWKSSIRSFSLHFRYLVESYGTKRA